MAAKQLVFGEEARRKLRDGIDVVAEAVATTLGPKGRNVVIDKKFGAPTVTKDGVTVAKEIELENKFENMGAQMVKEVASQTSDVAGDGTTTATVLAQAIFREGVKAVTAGGNPMDIKRGIDRATEAQFVVTTTAAADGTEGRQEHEQGEREEEVGRAGPRRMGTANREHDGSLVLDCQGFSPSSARRSSMTDATTRCSSLAAGTFMMN